MTDTQQDIIRICDRVKNLLLEKNMKYGDSALNPIRIMSQASSIEQILVRIDDKLNRLKQGSNLLFEDEDVIMDLIGYYVLLKVALEREYLESYTNETTES
jgi:hypothetical protein